MSLIKSVKISNFQSHKSTLIDFADQGCLTVITGPSDSGKSAVIRAIRWLCYNTPQGSDFITVGEDKCVVAITFEDGTVVERIRTRGGVNRYTVNGEVFEGFGTNVPLEVQQATGIKKLQIGDLSFQLNLSEQLDGPFLGKSVPGSARAKVLGKLAGTEEIDFAGKELGTDLYRAKRVQEGLEKDIESLQGDICLYDFIPSWEKSLSGAETLISKIKEDVGLVKRLKELLRRYTDMSVLVDDVSKTLSRLSRIDEAYSLAQTAKDQLEQGIQFAFLHGKHLRAFLDRENAKKSLNHLSSLYEKAKPYIDSAFESSVKASRLEGLYDKYNNASLAKATCDRILSSLANLDQADQYLKQAFSGNLQRFKLKEMQSQRESLVLKKTDFECSIDELNTAVEGLECEYIDLLSDLGRCPTCGSDIDIQKLKEVV